MNTPKEKETELRKRLSGLTAISLVLLLVSAGVLWALSGSAPPPTPTPEATLQPDIPHPQHLTPPPSLEEMAERYPQLGSLLRDPSLDSVYKEFLLAYQAGGIQAARELALQRGMLTERDEVRITLVIDSEENVQSVADEVEQFGIIVEGNYRDLIDIAIPMMFIEQFAQAEESGKLFEQLTQLEHIIKLRLPVPSRTSDTGRSGLALRLPPFPPIRIGSGACPEPCPEAPPERDFSEPSSRAQAEELSRAVEGRSRRGSRRVEGSEGPGVTGAEEWHAAGFTGQGIRVGVLDLGFNGYRDLLGKELPEQVVAKSFVRDEEPDSSGEVHGTACAEILHAMAPEAELYLAYYSGSEVGMGSAVEWLLEQGVDIISHSATGLVGPMDGSGSQAQLVDEVVAQGVLWVNASGNYATEHYRGTFSDVDGNNRHEFPNGKEVMVYWPPSHDAVIVLNWDDWAEAKQDFDLFLYDEDSNLVASSQNSQEGLAGDDPFEFIRLSRPGHSVYYIAIEAQHATRTVTFDLYAPDGEIEFPSAAYSLGTPGDASTSLTVGAVEWRSSKLEVFSSQGPTNDERLKPDLAGPDGVTTASYAPRSFPGTSAATPHIAGAAALVLSAFPDYSPQQVIDYLVANAVDLGPTGPDSAYGYGRLQLPQPEPNQPPPQPVEIPPTPVVAVPAPITPLPSAQPVAESNVSLGVLLCLGGFVCLGAIGTLGSLVALLIIAARPSRSLAGRGRGDSLEAPQSPPVSYTAEETFLLASDGFRTSLQVGENSVGRSHKNDIVLADDNQVSRHHATISWDGYSCAVTDQDSSNGTFVNGNRIPPRVPYPLHSGDRVRFGPGSKFVVRLPSGRSNYQS